MVAAWVFAVTTPLVHGHGQMYEPPPRIGLGLAFPAPTCPFSACLWFNQGTSIGCKNVSGSSETKIDCDNPAEPTITLKDTNIRTWALSPIYALDDYTKYHPWRYPGSAPVADPCGVAGGSWHSGEIYAGILAPIGAKQGSLGTASPHNKKLLAETEWVAGSTAEVAWGIDANHGGGYQYRLCPAGKEQTEECFQQMPLRFVGETQWIQFGYGMDPNNRTEIPAVTVTGDKVLPRGSTWRRNPVPGCNSPLSGGSNVWRRSNGTAVGLPWHKWNKDIHGRTDIAYMFSALCEAPIFPTPVKGMRYGYGGGACAAQYDDRACTPEEQVHFNFDFGVVDKVEVPKVPPGDYTLSFRWDSEQTNQVWSSCGDVRIKESGEGTKPFTTSPNQGCDACCPGSQRVCSNCTKCVNDKTGACAYCWDPLPGYNPHRFPAVTCLGHEAADGGARHWEAGMSMEEPWSPGCTKCWADENACKPQLRGVTASVMV